MNARRGTLIGVLLSGLLTSGASMAQEPQKLVCEKTRAEVRNECIDFLQKHRWDEERGDYVRKSTGRPDGGLVPPEGVKTREQIRAERDAFLRAYRWNEINGTWDPLGKQPRLVSKLSRAEMRKETTAFMKTHQWDDAMGAYVERRNP